MQGKTARAHRVPGCFCWCRDSLPEFTAAVAHGLRESVDKGFFMKKGNFIAAFAFAAFALYVIWQSSSFPGSKGNVPGPAVFPTAIATLMLMAAISLFITTIRMKPEEDQAINLARPECFRVYYCMAILLVYLLLMPVLGFCTASSVLLFGLVKWFGKYRFHVCALSAVAVTGIIYIVFSEVLHVPFRFGILL